MPGMRSLCLLAATLLATALLTTTATAEEAGDSGRLVLVLDSSGSMKEPAPGGGTRIEAAKEALGRVIDELPDDAQVGVRVFGAKVFSRQDPGACQDTQSVVPVGPLDRGALKAAVASYRPYGETPIGVALQEAAKDLGPGGERTIVLLSDGEPTCAPDPCQVAKRLTAQGIELKINVVGLDVSGKARRALSCIAREGKGTYYDARSAEDLANSLVKVSVRELRGFRLVGERVEGGIGSDVALPLEPGSYVDTALPEQQPRYYLVDKPKGGGVSVSALVRPPKGEENWNSVVRVDLLTPEGADCARAHSQGLQVLGQTPILTTAALWRPGVASVLTREECGAAEQLLAKVVVDSGAQDYGLRVTAYPAIENLDELPPALESDDGPWVARVQIPSGGERTPVVGGVTPEDAAELTPGTVYSDTLRPGEQLVYKVRAGYGQAIRFGARLGTDRQADAVTGLPGRVVVLRPVSALGQTMDRLSVPAKGLDGSGFYSGAEPVVVDAVVPEIRVRNAEALQTRVQRVSHDGHYYFVLGMGGSRSPEENDFAAPVTLQAELVGEVQGEPEYAAPVQGPVEEDRPAAQATAGVEDSGGVPGWLWATLGGVTGLLLLVAAFLLGRRRS